MTKTNTDFSTKDQQMMSLALSLAKKGIYHASPNPMVGCVIVCNGQIVGQGYHQFSGQAHAEVNALNEAGEKAQGASVYVTLEPCCHTGKTPPCVKALIKAKVMRVIVAILDPSAQMSGKGIAALKKAGIRVDVGLLSEQATRLNRGFLKRISANRPFVTAKIAMSLDGKIAMKNGESKWISHPQSRQDVQYLRGQSDAIVTGVGTVLTDNPSLNVRTLDAPQPLRVVLDSNHRLAKQQASFHILSDGGDSLIFSRDNMTLNHNGQIDLIAMLTALAQREINYVLLEAGGTLFSAMLAAKLIDELIIYQAPVLLGVQAQPFFAGTIFKMVDKIKWQILATESLGDDVKLTLAPL